MLPLLEQLANEVETMAARIRAAQSKILEIAISADEPTITEALTKVRLCKPDGGIILNIHLHSHASNGTVTVQYGIWDGTASHIAPTLRQALNETLAAIAPKDLPEGDQVEVAQKLVNEFNPLPF